MEKNNIYMYVWLLKIGYISQLKSEFHSQLQSILTNNMAFQQKTE